MASEPADIKQSAGGWLKACGIFALLTAGVAVALMVLGGSVGAALYLGLWPLIPAPVVFLLYVFMNGRYPEHLPMSGAVLGFVSAGIWTLAAMAIGAAYGLSAMVGEEKWPLLMGAWRSVAARRFLAVRPVGCLDGSSLVAFFEGLKNV
ncbi:MAG: hypothetical protein JF620_13105 [Mesorhizobium sp.]|jgi:hypothetical protein|nr:hypothetical protein [Mesorhizobium sp.]